MRTKRCFDVLVSLALLLPAAPVMAVAALAVLLGSGRPVLHRAERAGLHGRPFVMLKFRTMKVTSGSAAVTGPDDPRVTRVGRVLRSARLDELPQLFNVLRGDMSLVGPRPEDPRFVARYDEEQKRVLDVRPGVTSPTAIAYRDEAELLPSDPTARDSYYAEVLLPAKLALDLEYVRTRSMRKDIAILVETVATMLGSKEAAVEEHGSGRRILLLGELDGFANGARTRAVADYLSSRGHRVTVLETGRLSRASSRPGSLLARLPMPTPRRTMLYLVEAWGRIVARSPMRSSLSYRQIVAELRLRAHILRTRVDPEKFDLVVCETPHDAWYLTSVRSVPTWFDCPTPWADELLGEGRLTSKQHVLLRASERAVYESVTFLSFHWHSYADYVRDEYGLVRDILVVDWGTDERPSNTRPGEPPRVVYLGSLSSRFIDLPLLSRLCARYPHIDVYGAPPPDPALGLPYRGYATPEVLEHYQLGLITCTQDALRRRGFSAKHLEYLAAGLPVLAPRWRETDLGGTVAYDETDFADVVRKAGATEEWLELSDAARQQAAELRWDRTLAALDEVLAGLPDLPTA